MNDLANPRRIIGIVQPTYLPWLPLFERMAAADVFVLLDDVEYSKNTFLNRNAIKSGHGRQLLTVPVLYKGHSHAMINEIRVDDKTNWRVKHLRSIEQAYSGAAHWPHYLGQVSALYQPGGDRLIDVALPFIDLMRREFQIGTPVHLSSSLKIGGQRNEKLVKICQHFGGTHFIVKPGTDGYHPVEEFAPFGIKFAYLSYSNVTYRQLHGAFEPMLSGLDFLLNEGPKHPPFGARCAFPGEPAS